MWVASCFYVRSIGERESVKWIVVTNFVVIDVAVTENVRENIFVQEWFTEADVLKGCV